MVASRLLGSSSFFLWYLAKASTHRGSVNMSSPSLVYTEEGILSRLHTRIRAHWRWFLSWVSSFVSSYPSHRSPSCFITLSFQNCSGPKIWNQSHKVSFCCTSSCIGVHHSRSRRWFSDSTLPWECALNLVAIETQIGTGFCSCHRSADCGCPSMPVSTSF